MSEANGKQLPVVIERCLKAAHQRFAEAKKLTRAGIDPTRPWRGRDTKALVYRVVVLETLELVGFNAKDPANKEEAEAVGKHFDSLPTWLFESSNMSQNHIAPAGLCPKSVGRGVTIGEYDGD